jgi:Holliday junction resolvasome RuvABC endonuclease subunit
MNILGLDISSSITGASVIDESGKILYCESWDTRSKKHFPSLLHKARFLETKLLELRSQFEIDKVYIEESLQSFRSGFSSAKTLSVLSKINGIVSYIAYTIFGHEPEYLAATSARKLYGIKVAKGQKTKEVVLKHILDSDPDFVISYTRNNNPAPGSYDRADSLVIARSGLKECKKVENKS